MSTMMELVAKIHKERHLSEQQPSLADLEHPVGVWGFDSLTTLLADYIAQNKKIGVFGDYDVDGITSCAIITKTVRACGGGAISKVSERSDGYGLTPDVVRYFSQQLCDVLVILDCGTSDVEAQDIASALGLPLLIIDHHRTPDRPLDRLHTLLNPHHPQSSGALKTQCSAGLSFYVANAVRRHLQVPKMIFDPVDLLPIAAVGTFADQMPLRDYTNRAIARFGLDMMRSKETVWAAALLKEMKINQEMLSSTHIAFNIVPALNAPGRVASPQPVLDLLLSTSATEAAKYAEACVTANTARKRLTEQGAELAKRNLQHEPLDSDYVTSIFESPHLVAVASSCVAPGVAGIISSRLTEEYNRPAIVCHVKVNGDQIIGDPLPDDTEFFGSSRIPRNTAFDLYVALGSARGLLRKYGGHAAAAGFSGDYFRFSETMQRISDDLARQAETFPELGVAGNGEWLADATVDTSYCTEAFIDALEARIGPFGQGNEQPQVEMLKMHVVTTSLMVDKHFKVVVKSPGSYDKIICVKFGDNQPPVAGTKIDLLGALSKNYYMGKTTVQMIIKSWRYSK